MRKWFWTTAELHARGRSARQIRQALADGEVLDVRRGHFAAAGTPSQLLRAARMGGVVTGTTASRYLGLWTPPDPRLRRPPGGRTLTPADGRLYVAVPANTPRLRDPDDPARAFRKRDDVVVRWVDGRVVADAHGHGVAPPIMMLEHVFASQPAPRALAVVDSAIRNRFLRVTDLARLAAELPVHLRPVALSATGRADSGIESIARYCFETLGLHVEVLVGLSRIGTVDLLIDGWLIVELDGREFHEDEQFERDRRRDLESATARYRTLRFSWRQVMFEWAAVEAAVLAVLATR